MRISARFVGSAVIIAIWATSAARAQAPRSGANRPSEQPRPSQVLSQRSYGAHPYSGGGNAAGATGPATGGPRNRAFAPLDSVFQSDAGVGGFGGSRRRASVGTRGGAAPFTGLETAYSIPAPKIYIPPQTGSDFQRFFGLKPVEAEPQRPTVADGPDLAPAAGLDVSARIEAQTQRDIEMMWALAVHLFADGMNPATIDRHERVARAMQMVQAVRRLGAHETEATLLLLHLDLETQQTGQAMYNLTQLARSDPEIFMRPQQVASYFSDYVEASGVSELLLRQMRFWVRIGEANPDAPEAFAIEAYCAWTLGDLTRARAALQKLAQFETKVREKGYATKFDQFIFSMNPALP